jgi:uncharacterized protein YprB with RNaseH-like and TPR domain
MLQRTFSHISGIGPKIERRLWASGIRNWDDVLKQSKPTTLTPALWDKLNDALPSTKKAFAEHDTRALNQLLPANLHWRMIPNFFDEIAYLDIETTGMAYPRSHITTIAVYDGKQIHNFIRGENLDEFPAFIRRFSTICTFFGKGFDIPFIQSEMHVDFPQVHFDVCFLLRKLQISGGLKRIEQRYGIGRGDLDGIDGSSAVLLWQKYQRTKNPAYLDTLVAYNSEDVVNLEFLLVEAYNGLARQSQGPFEPLNYTKKDIAMKYHPSTSVLHELRNFYSI